MKRILFGFGAVLGLVALIGVLVFIHTRAVSNYGNERFAAGQADAYAKVADKARQLELKATALAAKLREHNDADNRAITAHVAALRVRGPGKAVCTSVVQAAPATGGHVEGSGSTDPAVGGVSDTERLGFIALPFSATLAAAGQCDANRAEVIAWRKFYEGIK